MPLTTSHHYFINPEERKREHVVTMMQITQLKQQNKQLWPNLCVQKQRQPHHDCGLAVTIKCPLLQDVFWLQRRENVTKCILESKNYDSIYLIGISEFINKRLPGVFPRWGNNGNSDRLYFLGSKISADGDFSHEIKICLLLGRKAMTNLRSILKSRGITLLTKVCLVKAMIFPVVTYGCES